MAAAHIDLPAWMLDVGCIEARQHPEDIGCGEGRGTCQSLEQKLADSLGISGVGDYVCNVALSRNGT